MAKGTVVLAVDRCKGCGLCTHVCPQNILVLSKDTFNAKGYHPVSVTDPEQCIGCASCARICPDVVFTVYRQVKTTVKPTVVEMATV
ncbi:MAG TPA: 4Fe-4S binding protein [Anaerolineae bacterium]|jgi:2-oxoglutarate ferredoxin oxidoreductase subunit delta|nr:4Fe-4S binding protein [Anaerolineae bacterium]